MLTSDSDLTGELSELFSRNYRVGVYRHDHVHGANMEVRPNAYFAAGEFPEVETSEDRELWNEVVRQGYRVVSPSSLRVHTSGRLRGRVVGGFADSMANAWT